MTEPSVQTTDEEIEDRSAASAATAAASTAGSQTARKVAERKQNPDFLEKYLELDLDSDKYPWLESEMSPLLSQAHPLSNRRESFERKSELLDTNRGEREIARHTPGRLLKQNEVVWAAMAGKRDPDAMRAYDSAHREAVRDTMDVASARKALGVAGRGSDALTTAVTEHSSVERGSESDGIKDKVSEVFR